MTARGRRPTKEKRPTCPCSADSSKKQGAPSGSPARSFKKAETGVSQSSTIRARTGTTLPSRVSSRASSRLGSSLSSPGLATTLIEYLHDRRLRHLAGGEQHAQVVDQVGGLFGDALIALLAAGPDDLLGLLLDLRPDQLGVVEKLDRIAAVGTLLGTAAQGPLEGRERFVGNRVRGPAAVEVAVEA